MASTSFSQILGDTRDVIFCSYRDDALLCFNGSHLTLVAHAPVAADGDSLFKKSTKISLCPAPPAASEITAIIANRSGSKVALVSRRAVSIVHMSEELWSCKSLVSRRQADTWQQEYFAECELLHMQLLMEGSPPAVTKAVWYSDTSAAQARKNTLGVLYSDNVIRIYDITESLATAIATVDLSSLVLGGEDPVEASANASRLGLISAVVSFDFGPVATFDGVETQTVVAVDSDGECYVCGITFDGACTYEPSLLRISGFDSRKTTGDPIDIVLVPSTDDECYSVIALAHESRVFHIVLIANDGNSEATSSNNLFEAFLCECLEFPSTSSIRSLVKVPRLAAGLTNWAKYLVLESNEVYAVDVGCLSALAAEGASSTMGIGRSVVRHIFTTLGDTNKENRPIAASHANLAVKSVAILQTEDYTTKEELVLISLLTTDGSLVTNVVRPHTPFVPKTKEVKPTRGYVPPAVAAVPPIAEQVRALMGAPLSIPKVPLQSLKRDQQLMFTSNAVDGLTKRMSKNSEVVDHVMKRGQEMAMQYTRAEQLRVAFGQQLAAIHDQMGQAKGELSKKRKRLELLMGRFERLARVLEPIMFPITDAEKETAERLKEMLKKLQSFASDTNKIGADVCAYRNRLLGPVKPFQATADAQKFMLSKNTTEIAQLQHCVERLSQEIEGLEESKC